MATAFKDGKNRNFDVCEVARVLADEMEEMEKIARLSEQLNAVANSDVNPLHKATKRLNLLLAFTQAVRSDSKTESVTISPQEALCASAVEMAYDVSRAADLEAHLMEIAHSGTSVREQAAGTMIALASYTQAIRNETEKAPKVQKPRVVPFPTSNKLQ